MADYFNDDFKEFLKAFDNRVDYILVNGMAVILISVKSQKSN